MDRTGAQPALSAFALPGRVAVVTGAARGIGREIAVVLAEAGADLVVADLAGPGLTGTAELVRRAGRRALSRPTDVRVRDEVELLADAALAEFGRLDVWINSAGIIGYFSLDDATEPEVRRIVEVNQLGAYWAVAAAGRRMAAAGTGSIVTIASTGGEIGAPRLSAYGMTKAAVMHLTKTAAVEYGPRGVRVNAVAPGFVDTPMVAGSYTAADGTVDETARHRLFAHRSATTALGRIGSPRDIALTVLYLAGDASSFVTGQTLRANGGTTMA